jgi:hypothetical protein
MLPRVSVSRFAYPEHLQPGHVFLGSVPDKVYSLNVSLLPVTLGEIDQARALGAEDIHP